MKKEIYTLLLLIRNLTIILSQDPFTMLGIPALTPDFLDDKFDNHNLKLRPSKSRNLRYSSDKYILQDLPFFLEKAEKNNMNQGKTMSKFLIADDYFLKKYGAVYDETGFDGLLESERVAPIGSPIRLVQRAKSAATIWFKKNYTSGYEAYGAEIVNDQGNPFWKVFKVLLVGKYCGADHEFVKVCIPVSEDLIPLVVNENEECMSKVHYIEDAYRKNLMNSHKSRTNHFLKIPNTMKINSELSSFHNFDRNPSLNSTNLVLNQKPIKYSTIENKSLYPKSLRSKFSKSSSNNSNLNEKLSSFNRSLLLKEVKNEKNIEKFINNRINSNYGKNNTSDNNLEEIKFVQVNDINIIEKIFESSKTKLLKILKFNGTDIDLDPKSKSDSLHSVTVIF